MKLLLLFSVFIFKVFDECETYIILSSSDVLLIISGRGGVYGD